MAGTAASLAVPSRANTTARAMARVRLMVGFSTGSGLACGVGAAAWWSVGEQPGLAEQDPRAIGRSVCGGDVVVGGGDGRQRREVAAPVSGRVGHHAEER